MHNASPGIKWKFEYRHHFGAYLTWIVQNGPAILAGLGEWSKQFGIWVLTQGLPALVTALGQMFGGLWTELQRLWKAAFAEGSIGKALIDGLINGIRNGWSRFANWFVGLLRALIPDWAEQFIPGLGTPAAPATASAPPPSTGAPTTRAPAPAGAPTTTTRTGAGTQVRRPGSTAALAGGGDTEEDGSYLVGEYGPEIFEPGRRGRVHPNSVYRAITNPIAALAPASAGARASLPRLALPAAPAPAAAPAQGAQINLTIQNPVVDSDARLEQLKAELRRLLHGDLAAVINRLLLAEG